MRIAFAPIAAAALALWGCGAPAVTAQCPPQPGTVGNTVALGTLDGKPITRGELDPQFQKRLAELQNESEQRKLHLLWAGLEQAIGERLLAQEAAARGISVAELRRREIDARVSAPTDDEVRAFYDANAAAIGVAFEVAAPHIESELFAQRRAEAERAFVETLRAKAEVRYTLPAPELPRVAMEVGDGPALGPEDAKVTLVAFSDFQCPYCARARHLLESLHQLYPDDLRIVFRHYPLPQHPSARQAAVASECAHAQGKFWPYHDLLFDNANALAPNDLTRYAQQVGLDAQAFAACMSSEEPRRRVEEAQAAGRRMGVEGTPAIYINGVKLVGLLPLPLMQSLIDRELGR